MRSREEIEHDAYNGTLAPSPSLVHRYNLRYCEGLVWNIIPIVHAWNLDEDGKVVDLTLPPEIAKHVQGYWGVEFSLDKLIRLLEERKTYGPFIDDYERGYPLYDKPWS